MKIAYLGTGSWGFCLSFLLANNGHEIISWSKNFEIIEHLKKNNEHPLFNGFKIPKNLVFTSKLEEALNDCDVIVESVTSQGIFSVFNEIKNLGVKKPIILTSKGLDHDSGKILPEIILNIFGDEIENKVGVLSGPSFAQDVIKGLPTSVVASAYNNSMSTTICDLFNTKNFRVYPNKDIYGVCYGGALKNIIAIACGIAGGLSLGHSCTAALMTRGLHEIKKLALLKNSHPETLYGLSGMGDLCLTCNSILSRNYRFGYFIAEGDSVEQARKKINMVIEGADTCISALTLSKSLNISMPITEVVYKIIYENLNPKEAVYLLMNRSIKEEHL